MAKFEALCWNFSLSINLFFLKSDILYINAFHRPPTMHKWVLEISLHTWWYEYYGRRRASARALGVRTMYIFAKMPALDMHDYNSDTLCNLSRQGLSYPL